jgi:hypothetical protein
MFEDTTVLHPFEGYYFRNRNNWTELKIPYPFPVPRLPVLPSSLIDWRIQVVLETSSGVDRLNYAGIAPDALAGIDRLDKPKPVALGNRPYLTFDREDAAGQVLGSDLRPELGEGQVWLFNVVNAAGKEAVLRFVPDESFPEGIQATLVNVDANDSSDVLSDSTYAFRGVRSVARFMLIVGQTGFVESVLENTIPDRFALSQNYPNPFNPETSFDLDVPWDSDVTLSIYSMLGEEIDLIASGTHPAGRYTYVWKGTNHTGLSVASGVYFIRCMVDGNPMFLRKMLLLR